MDNREFAEQLELLQSLRHFVSPGALKLDEEEANEALTEGMSNSAIPGLIGKTVKAETDEIYFDGDNPVAIYYNIVEGIKSIEIILADNKGNIVGLRRPRKFKTGENIYRWDGKDKNRRKCARGFYKVILKSMDINKYISEIKIFIKGKIRRMEFHKDSVSFKVDNLSIPFDKIMDIEYY